MINIKLLRENFDNVRDKINTRGKHYQQLDKFAEIDNKYRKLISKIQNLNELRNNKTNLISEKLSSPSSESKSEINNLKNEVKNIKKEIDSLKIELDEIEKMEKDILLSIPNIPHESVVLGKDENDNKEISKWGEPTKFDFQPLPHWELGKKINLIDFERANKISGSRYIIYTGKGAKLLRSLIWYTIEKNTEAGFFELMPPAIVNNDTLIGTGQLPKFKDDLYCLTDGKYLSPTGEVQMTNYFSGEILNYKNLPKFFTCNTPCFRSEAGSAGKDTKGVIRQHQFYKTEMVIISTSEDSWKLHEFMTRNAEKLLEGLNLPYRRLLLCTGDMGFSAAKTYDLEVWLPSYNAYKEISSCSNCTDFQARNMGLRYYDKDKKINYCHTLNGSGLAIDRLWAAVVENYQQKDMSIKIPKALKPFFNNEEYIK